MPRIRELFLSKTKVEDKVLEFYEIKTSLVSDNVEEKIGRDRQGEWRCMDRWIDW